jgi:biopolymer transport protein ExbD
MQLQTGSPGVGLQSEINITPLVDVVLVLLIIFMVVVPLLLKGYDVGVPQTSSDALPSQNDDTQIVLSIGPKACAMVQPPAGEGLPADCRVTLADREIPAAELPGSLAQLMGGRATDQRVLFLAADDRLNYEGVLRIVDLAKSGVDDLRIEFVSAE